MSDESAAVETSTESAESEPAESAAPEPSSGGGAPVSDAPATDIAGGAIAAQQAKDDAQAAAQARKWRLKYDGKEHEIASEDELVKLAQKGLGADRRFEEAAMSRKQVEAAVRKMAEDPLAVLAKLHGDGGKAAQVAAEKLIANPEARRLLEKLLLDQLEYEGLPEEERAKRDADRTLREKASKADRYEAEEKRRREEAEAAKRAEAQAAEVERLSKGYAEEARASLTAAGLDPNDPDIAERWILQRQAALAAGVEMTAEEAAQRVAAKVGGSRKGHLESLAKLEGEALLAAFPPALLTRIQAATAAKLTGPVRNAARAPAGAPRAKAPAKPARSYSPDAMVRAYGRLGIAETQRRMAAGEDLT